MKNIRRALKSVILSSVICLSLVIPIHAQDKNVSITPIFTEEHGPWYPGKDNNNNFTISNNLNMPIKLQKMYITLQNLGSGKTDTEITEDSKGYKEIINNSNVTIKYGMKDVYKGNLNSLLDEDGISLSEYSITIGSKSSTNLNMNISMDGENITNDAQAIKAEYNITLDYREYNTEGGGGSITPPIDPPPVIPEPDDPEVGEPDDPEVGEPSIPEPDDNNGSNVGGSDDKLPQTGGIINGTSLAVLGVAIAGIGIILDSKSSDKGGKSDE